jgi:hypothetical protein
MKPFALIMLAAGVALAGCGGSSGKSSAAGSVATSSPPTSPTTSTTAPTTSTTISLADLAKQYEAAVAAANKAGDLYNSKAAKLPDNATAAQFADIAEPLAKAFQDADQALIRIQWPANIKTDMAAVVTANGALEGDLLAARSQNLFSLATFTQQITSDAGKSHAAVSILRADLGLPPPKS